MSLVTLQNSAWQAGILPETGSSAAFGRVNVGGNWRDALRPTAEKDYGNSSLCGSFIMMPWANRIAGGLLRFNGAEYPLRTEKDDGTARHGDVRKRAWQVIDQSDTHVITEFDSTAYPDINFPFRFGAQAEYRLEGEDFIWRLALENRDEQPFPAGFGHHPYFVREPVSVQIPCDAIFELRNALAFTHPAAVPPEINFRVPMPLGDLVLDHVFTRRQGDQPARITYPDFSLEMSADPLYKHFLIYAPPGAPFFALEPMTNVNDGFNLHERGISEAGVFVLQPGERAAADMRLTVTMS